MNKRPMIMGLIVIALVTVSIAISLASARITSGNDTDTDKGIEYIVSAGELDAASVEAMLRNPDGNNEETTVNNGEDESNNNETIVQETTTQETMPGGNFASSNQECYMPYYVDKKKAEEAVNGIADGSKNLWSVFSGTLFVGDSIMTGFSDFQFVNSGQVLAEVGSRLNSHLADNMNTIINYNPEVVLIHYGINEIEVNEHFLDEFIATYTQDINTLKASLPNTKIIIIGLTPVKDVAVQRQERFGRVAAYNERIRKMCVELGVGYEENSSLFTAHQELYEADGIHFMKSLYVMWMTEFVKEMGLY